VSRIDIIERRQMFEIFLLFCACVIIYSVIQGASRGKVSIEARKESPTLVETIAVAAGQFADNSRKFLDSTKFEIEYCGWFKTFERRVSFSLKSARGKLELEEQLDADPSLRHHFEQAMARYQKAEKDKHESMPESQAYARERQLDQAAFPRINHPAPPSTDYRDPEKSKIQLQIYEKNLKSHQIFVNAIKKDLSLNHKLRKFFEESMILCQNEALIKIYFPDEVQIASIIPDGNLMLWLRRYQASIADAEPVVQPEPSLGNPGVNSLVKHILDRDEIRTLAIDLGIPHLIHFTRCENLPSISRHGLRSIANLDTHLIESIRNDRLRLDLQPDGTSLSITFPNYRMFYKYRQLDPAAEWAVLILSPSILWKKECGFYKNNAADSRMRSQPKAMTTTTHAFEEMFEAQDSARESWLRRYDTTDPQAEVMVYETIEASFVEAVAFETAHIAAKWAPVLSGIERIHAGPGNGLFASRKNVRLN
jgi:hypothetical protein